MLDEDKDKFIKEKFSKDDLISKKADDVFNNFFKEVQNMENEKINNTTNEKVIKKNFRFRKILAIAASVVILFTGANVYAKSKGYDNIFFMIKFLTTGEKTQSEDEILISNVFLDVTDKISCKVEKLKTKNDDYKLVLQMKESELESKQEIVPLEYRVFNENDEELCYQPSVKKNNALLTEYTEELKLKNYNKEEKVLTLKIYSAEGTVLSNLKIDLENKVVEVQKEEEKLTVNDISAKELKPFLGYISGIFNDSELSEKERLIEIAIELKNGKQQIESVNGPTGNIAFDAKTIEDIVKSISNENLSDFKTGKWFKKITVSGKEYYEYQKAADLVLVGKCDSISEISYEDGAFKVKYSYFFPGDSENEESSKYDVYENTVKVTVNSDETHSKFKLVDYNTPVKIANAKNSSENENNKPNPKPTEEETNNNVNNDDNNNNNNNTNNSNIYTVVNKYNGKEYTIDKTKVTNYASAMKWTNYWAPGIKFDYPTEFELEEIGGYNRGNNSGKLSTKLTGMAVGINKETGEIIDASLQISVYEPEIIVDVSNIKYAPNGLEYGYTTTKNGLRWYETTSYDQGDTVHTYTCVEPFNPGDEKNIILKIEFRTDKRDNNYKILNIENWLIGTTKLTSY